MHCVYAAKADGFIKVGYSADVHKRLYQLETKNRCSLSMLFCKNVPNKDAGLYAESRIHSLMVDGGYSIEREYYTDTDASIEHLEYAYRLMFDCSAGLLDQKYPKPEKKKRRIRKSRTPKAACKERDENCFMNKVKYLRFMAGMTQQDLADALAYDRSYISLVERGKFVPDVQVKKAIARVLGRKLKDSTITPDYIFDGTGDG